MLCKKIEIKNYSEGEDLDKIEFQGHVILKRLNFSEKNSLEEESTDIKMYGNTPQVKVSSSKMKEFGLFKSIVSWELKKTTYFEDKLTNKPAPVTENYPLNMQNIQGLPSEIGEFLFEQFTELNSVSEKKNVN